MVDLYKPYEPPMEIIVQRRARRCHSYPIHKSWNYGCVHIALFVA